jgi:hypothetical protein
MKDKTAAAAFRHGQCFVNSAGSSLYGDAHKNLARTGKQKNLAAAPTHPSMASAPKNAKPLSAFHHGVTVQDEPLTAKLTGKNVPVHNGMGSENPEHRGQDFGPDHGSKILGAAGPASWRSDVGGKHGEFILDKSARLPPPIKRR